MTDNGLVIIGSGPAAVSAAIGYRDAGGSGPVRLVSSDVDLPYERPPLSKDLLQGETDADDTYLHQREFYVEHGIELLLGTTAAGLDPDARAVALSDGRRLGYGACVLATGAEPIRPRIPGADGFDVHLLRSLRDGTALRQAGERATRAVVVGSGFIGCEAAASLARRGLRVTLISTEEHPHAARLGGWAADRIAEWLRALGIDLVLGDGVAAITDDPAARVRTESRRAFAADLVLLATGVQPRIELADDAGLTIEDGRIRVDESMRTSAGAVFAAGDVALATNTSAGRPVAVEHWGDALAMGEIAGRAAAGRPRPWAQAPGFWSSIGDHTIKYSAWGDGYDEARVDEHGDGAFTVWYLRADRVVGVLTHDADDDYDRGQALVEAGAAPPG